MPLRTCASRPPSLAERDRHRIHQMRPFLTMSATVAAFVCKIARCPSAGNNAVCNASAADR